MDVFYLSQTIGRNYANSNKKKKKKKKIYLNGIGSKILRSVVACTWK